MTKGAIVTFTKALSKLVIKQGIRATGTFRLSYPYWSTDALALKLLALRLIRRAGRVKFTAPGFSPEAARPVGRASPAGLQQAGGEIIGGS
jgi:hypothetical protein